MIGNIQNILYRTSLIGLWVFGQSPTATGVCSSHIKFSSSSTVMAIYLNNGYLGFISCEWFLLAWEWTHTEICT